MTDSARQRAHYERLVDVYEQHYFDKWSQRYRERFIYDALWGDLDCHGKDVAELACGSGQNSVALLQRFPSARVDGYDISPSACDRYRRRVNRPAYAWDLTRPLTFPKQYDVAFVIGGMHHCIADLKQTLANVAAMLRPGGLFLMLEPSSRHLLERLRRLWYRLDGNFDAANEHALDHDDLLALAGPRFEVLDVSYAGGPAYFFVLNSMITRVPLWMKPAIGPPLLALEHVWNAIPLNRLHNVFIARWTRTGAP